MENLHPNTLLSQSLEKIRKRLLELSARNRLINFRHTKTGCIRIINELPDLLAKKFISEKELRFYPVPKPSNEELIQKDYLEEEKSGKLNFLKKEPDAKEWANQIWGKMPLNVPISDENIIKIDRPVMSIQTLLYPDELETRLRHLWQSSKTAIEETGANILYMAFGFLEWFDPVDKKSKRLAPLFLIPVQLKKGRLNKTTSTFDYTIKYTGEDIIKNLSLLEKLRLDFNLKLPDLDEKTLPEMYFNKILNQIIKQNQPQWILHRYITLSLFNFSKLLMYLDLSPERWSSDYKITNHEIVSLFLAGTNGINYSAMTQTNFLCNEEYNIDSISDIHYKYPLIDNADSSQHSAIIDALKGKNLVIEGPPGTGKSQAITNLIAAAMSQNKTVLFVAEKLAALEVVKHRLDKVGLGDFCLEMHSHKSQKRQVLDSIKKRLGKKGSFRDSLEIDADIRRYENLKETLKSHAELINSPYKRTGKTIHEIFVAASRYKKIINLNLKTLHPEGVNGDNFDPIAQRETKDLIQNFIEINRSLIDRNIEYTSIKNHPWYGIRSSSLSTSDENTILSKLEKWQSSIKDFILFKEELSKKLDCNIDSIPDTINELDQLYNEVNQLPELKGNELLFSLPSLKGDGLVAVQKHLTLFYDIQSAYKIFDQSIDSSVFNNFSHISTFSDSIKSLKKIMDESVTFDIINNAIQISSSLNDQLSNLSQWLKDILKIIGPQFKEFFSPTESGLKELKQFIDIVLSLKISLWEKRDPLFENEELDKILPVIRKECNELRMLYNELKQIFDFNSLPDKYSLYELRQTIENGGVFKWFKKDWRAAKKNFLFYRSSKRVKFREMRPKLEKVLYYIEKKYNFENNENYSQLLLDHFKGMNTNLNDIEDIRTWYSQIQNKYGVGFGRKIPLKKSIIEMPIEKVKEIQNLLKSGVSKHLENIINKINYLKTTFPLYKGFHKKKIVLVGKNNHIKKFQKLLIDKCSNCEPLLSDPSLTIKEISDQIKLLKKLNVNISNWESNQVFSEVFNEQIQLKHGIDKDNDHALACLKNTLFLANHLDKNIQSSFIRDIIYQHSDKMIFETLNKSFKSFKLLFVNQLNKCKDFQEYTKMNLEEWTALCKDSITMLTKRNQNAISNIPALYQWLTYLRIIDQLADRGVKKLVNQIDNETISLKNAEYAYYAVTYDFLAQEILKEHPGLEKFSGRIHENFQKQFCEYDYKLKKLQCERIAWKIDQNLVPRGNYGGRVNEYTECSLIEHECSKKMRHIPIRQLLKRASRSLLSLKPCFMMGPMSVAHYLTPGDIVFDIVIMDEASQIKPEDALGAIARGKQLIVVGDPKQLPPTSFFQRIIDEDHSEITAIEESKSILDAALPMFPMRQLRWHYRSEHESLIAFSNHHFYDDQLMLFPSPHNKSEDFGIQYTRVNGCFINRRNQIESIEISHAVREHLINNNNESLGVVAMNAEQRNDIEHAIEKLAKEDLKFQKLLEKDQKKQEPLFIKNLENVQGDERDVIYISMTYGPKKLGEKVLQRFGPINSDVGHRRLNVLFTRSRKRMYIFTSMNATDIIIGQSSKRGVKAFRNFLTYAETGELDQTIDYSERLPKNDFEITVSEALQKEGFECTAQLGVAGFFIDIAVKDPANLGRYLMGIECDGPTYHSIKSTRDRDQLRQRILEQKGWCIRRIWSADWYKNPENEIQPIIKELKQMISKPLAELIKKEKKISTEYMNSTSSHYN